MKTPEEELQECCNAMLRHHDEIGHLQKNQYVMEASTELLWYFARIELLLEQIDCNRLMREREARDDIQSGR